MLRRFFLPALNFILPTTCAACGQVVGSQEGPVLCAPCFNDLKIHKGPQCYRCATQVDALFARPDLQCAPCLSNPPAFFAARAGLIYTQTARQLILGLKHANRQVNADLLARYMAQTLPDLRAPILIPVPLHIHRLRARGFNQSLSLARAVQRIRPLPLAAQALIRTRDTPSQGTQSARGRLSNVTGAFAIQDAQAIHGRDVILVDDVITSGATARALSHLIIKAGAESVFILAAARALPK